MKGLIWPVTLCYHKNYSGSFCKVQKFIMFYGQVVVTKVRKKKFWHKVSRLEGSIIRK